MYRILLLLSLVMFSPLASADTLLRGRVIHVTDGDTLTLLDAKHQRIKVRLAEIDCPEQSQPYGKRAKLELKTLVHKKNVEITVIDVDRYDRVVGQVRASGVDINAEMVRRGAAWAYRRHLKRPELIQYEQAAREAALGLWALPPQEHIPPWQWRHQQRQSPH